MINILPSHSGTAVPNLSFLLRGVTSFQEELKKKKFFLKTMEFFQDRSVFLPLK